MSANLNETSAPGATWTRCTSVSIANPATGTPSILFTEAKVAEVGAIKIEQVTGSIAATFSPSSAIPLRSPSTGELTGESVTQDHLYQILYSLYVQKGLERNAA